MKNKFNISILTKNDDDSYYFNYIDHYIGTPEVHYTGSFEVKYYNRSISHDWFGIGLIKRLK